MNDCIFCKIASGAIPAYKLYEDDEFVVILDRFPSSVGHSLVVPKTHAADVFELDNDAAARAFGLAARIAERLKAKLGCTGVNILQNNGEAAGQTVMHFHVHIVPRYEKDDVSIKWKALEPSDAQMESMRELVGEGC